MLHRYIIVLAIALPSWAQLQAQTQLSLNEALEMALINNPQLRQSALEERKATAGKAISRSMFLPSVHAGAQLNHYFRLPAFFGFGENSEGGKIPYGRLGGEDQLGASITLVQPLYNPVAYPSYEHAELRQQQSAVVARAKKVEVRSEVEDTYFSILVLQERRRLTQESINRNQKVLNDSRMLLFQGKGLRVDTLRAYTSVKNLEPDLVKITYAIETAKLQLRSLIGLDSLNNFDLVDTLVIPESEVVLDEAFVYDEVIRNNPEFQILKINSELDARQVRIAAAYRKPTLSLIGEYQVFTQTKNFEYGNAHYPSSAFAGLQLSVPLFTGLRAKASANQAAYTREQSDLEIRRQREVLRARVHDVIARNKEAQLRLKSTAVVQESAQLSYDIIQYRYKNGISPRLELTDAELALSSAQSNYLEAAYDYLSARIALRKLIGI